MTWTDIKKWAKELGYDTIKDKDDGKYYWQQSGSNNDNDCGVATSVSKLAKAVYNHYTNYKWLDHQTQFNNSKEIKKSSISDYGK